MTGSYMFATQTASDITLHCRGALSWPAGRLGAAFAFDVILDPLGRVVGSGLRRRRRRRCGSEHESRVPPLSAPSATTLAR